MNQKVGKIKQIIYNEDNDSLDVVIEIVDKKFQKKLLRDLTFSGNLSVDGDELIYISSEENEDAALSVSMPKLSE
jgi:hypothetical protein